MYIFRANNSCSHLIHLFGFHKTSIFTQELHRRGWKFSKENFPSIKWDSVKKQKKFYKLFLLLCYFKMTYFTYLVSCMNFKLFLLSKIMEWHYFSKNVLIYIFCYHVYFVQNGKTRLPYFLIMLLQARNASKFLSLLLISSYVASYYFYIKICWDFLMNFFIICKRKWLFL